jgi:hypothetical protein
MDKIKKEEIKKNPYLNPDGSFNLIDEYVGTNYKHDKVKPKKEKDDIKP